jgi:uncharacterized protein YjbJ (UPF0337 family)
MRIQQIRADWDIIKGKCKQRWASLTDNDVEYFEGKKDVLYGCIQKRTGETREAVEKRRQRVPVPPQPVVSKCL